MAIKLFRRRQSKTPSTDTASSYPATASNPTDTNLQWRILVDQSKVSLEKGGGATLDALTALAPAHVLVEAALLPSSKQKPPSLRCISLSDSFSSFDAGNVDSADKCHRVLTRHMKASVPMAHVNALKFKYKGNAYLEADKVNLAIDAYTKALQLDFVEQEGVLLQLRATAYLRRAALHQQALESNVQNLLESVPTGITEALEAAKELQSLQPLVLDGILREMQRQNQKYRQTQYRHGLYQYTLLQAAQDALRATELLPTYATCWLRAGEILAELWRLKESVQYYERAMELDESLRTTLAPTVMESLRKRQQLLDNTRAVGWPEDTLRLALDVAG